MGNAGSFVASVALFCGVGFLPALHSIHFLPMLEPLFDRTLCLILEEKEGGGEDACSATSEQTMQTVTSAKHPEGPRDEKKTTVYMQNFPYGDYKYFSLL